ncbi:MAG: hypothetical protein H7145_21885 [Akkermansiaceae bacterium]|nr:hypothetical protein [Armatimonadota bacterium]
MDRALAFPVEDLYADGQPAGQVGQEIYGRGGAWTFVTRGYERIPNMALMLFSEYPVYDRQWEMGRTGATCGVTFRTCGAANGGDMRGRVCVVSPDGSPVPKVAVCVTENGDEVPLPVTLPEPGRTEAWVGQGAEVIIRW